MLLMILISCLLIIFSTIVHTGCTMLTLVKYRALSAMGLGALPIWKKAWWVAMLVMVLFLAAVIEVGAWAMTYLLIGVIDDAETAFYFSAVTFTTLGYGDVVLEAPARILASFEAINGILIFGWSTALLVAFLSALIRSAKESEKW